MKNPRFIYLDTQSIEPDDNFQVDSYLACNDEGENFKAYISVEQLDFFLKGIIDEEMCHGQLRRSQGIRETARRVKSFIRTIPNLEQPDPF